MPRPPGLAASPLRSRCAERNGAPQPGLPLFNGKFRHLVEFSRWSEDFVTEASQARREGISSIFRLQQLRQTPAAKMGHPHLSVNSIHYTEPRASEERPAGCTKLLHVPQIHRTAIQWDQTSQVEVI
jgi:hypothetical protein